MNAKGLLLAFVLVLFIAGHTPLVLANGYKILCMKSAKATAMGEAFIVQADDPSAIAFNPAGLVQLEGHQINVHATLCNALGEHIAPSGEKTDMNLWQMVPSLFATTDLGMDRIAAGIGVSLPNGVFSEWTEDSFARYVATHSDLTVVDISPVLSCRVMDRLMLGGGINLYYSEVQLENMMDMGFWFGFPGSRDMENKLKGDGTATGFNIGAIYRISPRHRVAFTYRHPFSIDYDATLTLPELGQAEDKSDGNATVDFPAVAVLGYALWPINKLKIELNLDWTRWNEVDDVIIRSKGMLDVIRKQGLHNTMAYKLGLEYKYTEKTDWRCGYIFNENATPDETWRPSLPDSDTHLLTVGVGYHLKHLMIDTALLLVFYEERSIDNNVDDNEILSSSSIDGVYDSFVPCLTMSLTHRF